MITPSLSGRADDPIDQALRFTAGEVLRPPASTRGGEYDHWRAAGNRQVKKRLIRAGLVSAGGQPADVLADMVEARNGPRMNGDEFCAWWIDQCIAGLDLRRNLRRSWRQELQRERQHYDERGWCELCGIRPICDCNRAPREAANPTKLTGPQRYVLGNLYRAHERGLTDWQHHQMCQSTAGKRRLDLMTAGLVAPAGRRRLNPNDVYVNIWIITAEGAEVWQRLPLAERRNPWAQRKVAA